MACSVFEKELIAALEELAAVERQLAYRFRNDITRA
jgi:head-tail adaptor